MDMQASSPAPAVAAPSTPAPAAQASAQAAPAPKKKANRPNRKASDEDIIRLNSIGLSLGTIAKTLDVHPTTITLRLKGLGIEPADTRRSFMEDIILAMPEDQIEWLSDQVGPNRPIKDFVRDLIIAKFVEAQ